MIFTNGKKLIILILLFTYLSADNRYAFIYSKNVDDRFINFYDKVVVEADAVDNIYAIRYPKKMVAYVSVGEIEPWRKTKTPYDKSWVISKNKTWNSLIGDLRKEGYQKFIFERIATLYKRGYRNFFLDTMDAYHVTHKDKELFKKQQKALVGFIHKLHSKYPKSKIIVNRGFEILKEIHSDIDAVVAESLLNRYNHAKKEYIAVPKADREWLLGNFKKAKEYGLDAISIEYTNKNTKERLGIAKVIKELGMIPYVTDGLLQEQGECDIQRVRRDILILFNKSIFKDKNSVYSDVHLLASLPLEYLGYVPILYDISTKELPQRVEDRYHSVIVWSEGITKSSDSFKEWAKIVKSKGIKILFLNNFIFNPTKKNLADFGIDIERNFNNFTSKTKTKYHNSYSPFEIPASVEFEDTILKPKDSTAVLSVAYKNSQESLPIAVTPWGGYAIGNSFLLSIADENYWTIDPFKFFREALRLNEIPVPDPTTEAGRRILLVHVDGDGFVERVRFKKDMLSTEYLIEYIYKRYKIPQTVSLIQGEMESLFPKLTPRMRRVAKMLYQIPWIEPASHTRSHPFFWDKVILPQNAPPNIGKNFHLPLKNYHFTIGKETIGSIEYALQFAPKSRRKRKILFWSGDCIPPRKVLAFIERKGILAMNGGDTTIQKSEPWLSHIAPFGIQREEYWQIYTGQQNENVYTHDWLGPFWGYRNAIETFELTEKPRRLKPINIYYHFYSGSKLASFKALQEVYDWAVAQKTSKLYASQYIKKSRGFYRTAIAKTNNGFEIRNSGSLRTLRFDREITVDMKNSQGVAGYSQESGKTYITLDSGEEYNLRLNGDKSLPYLIDSNGWMEESNRGAKTSNFKEISFRLKANVPLEANFYLPPSCGYNNAKGFNISKSSNILSFTSKEKRGLVVAFKCP